MHVLVDNMCWMAYNINRNRALTGKRSAKPVDYLVFVNEITANRVRRGGYFRFLCSTILMIKPVIATDVETIAMISIKMYS